MTKLRASCTTFSDWLSSALVASSKSRTLGFLTIALAIATLCFCPPDNFSPRGPTILLNPSPDSSFSMNFNAFACSAAFLISSNEIFGAPYRMLSSIEQLKRTGS
mmetsp:Transcript_40919/g.47053  ORF Transcript_40919/g.47053 Transcript_40919/m.47053 type:complete len:105 (+) Transcript_40919:299-613(+)